MKRKESEISCRPRGSRITWDHSGRCVWNRPSGERQAEKAACRQLAGEVTTCCNLSTVRTLILHIIRAPISYAVRDAMLCERRIVVQSESSDGLIDGAIWGIGEM